MLRGRLDPGADRPYTDAVRLRFLIAAILAAPASARAGVSTEPLTPKEQAHQLEFRRWPRSAEDCLQAKRRDGWTAEQCADALVERGIFKQLLKASSTLPANSGWGDPTLEFWDVSQRNAQYLRGKSRVAEYRGDFPCGKNMMIFTLAHELGHWQEERRGFDTDLPARKQEALADFYGLELAQLIGVDRRRYIDGMAEALGCDPHGGEDYAHPPGGVRIVNVAAAGRDYGLKPTLYTPDRYPNFDPTGAVSVERRPPPELAGAICRGLFEFIDEGRRVAADLGEHVASDGGARPN